MAVVVRQLACAAEGPRIVDPSTRDGEAEAGKWWVSENVVVGFPEVTKDNWKGVTKQDAYFRLSEPWPAMPINQQTAEEAYKAVLASVGCSRPARDAIDARIIEEVRTGTASKGDNGFVRSQEAAGGWPELEGAAAPTDTDTDNDGIPDAWETQNGLDAHDAADGAKDLKGTVILMWKSILTAWSCNPIDITTNYVRCVSTPDNGGANQHVTCG